MEKIKVINNPWSRYKDGGTDVYVDKKGKKYYKDGRIGTKTKGKIFDRYPKDKGAKILDVELEVVKDF